MGDSVDYRLLKICIEQDFNPQEKRKAIPRKTVETVRKRDKERCRICGYERWANKYRKRIMFTHHIRPKEPSTPENLIVICKACHDYIHTLHSRRVKGFKFYIPK